MEVMFKAFVKYLCVTTLEITVPFKQIIWNTQILL